MKTHTWIAVATLGTIPAALIGWAIGQQQLPVEPQVVEVVVAEPPSFPDLSLGPRFPGTWSWRELRGGECVMPYVSEWEETFDVVNCLTTHQAEFVRATLMSTEAEDVYPGDDAIREFAVEHCANWEQDDLDRGERFDDLIVTPSYSLGLDAWQSGDRLVGCFVSRLVGGIFTDKLVVE